MALFVPVTLRRVRNTGLKSLTRSLKLAESGDVEFRPPPKFDFLNKDFNSFRALIDPTWIRFKENTISIVVDGSIGCGKSVLAARLAKLFGINYFPDITEDDIFTFNDYNPPFDLRSHNAILPDSAKYYTCEMFWNEPNLMKDGKPLYLQWQFFLRRHYNYLKALCTLFNTGVGFVMDRSPFSELAWSDALYHCGLMSERASRWYNQHHGVACILPYKPHIIVYIKTTKEQIREHFKSRNIPWEMNGINLTDDFLDALAYALDKNYVEKMKRFSIVVPVDGTVYDVRSEDVAQIIAQGLTELDLSLTHYMRDEQKLLEWRTLNPFKMTKRHERGKFSDSFRVFTEVFDSMQVPMDMLEGTYGYEQRRLQFEILNTDPRTKFQAPFNPNGTSLFNIMFNPFMVKGNYRVDRPRRFLWYL